MSEKIKILIADDHQLVLDGLTLMLDSQDDFVIVGAAHNGLEVMSFLENNHVDIVLLDLNMPEMNGLETCKLINKQFSDLKVLILSMMSEVKLVKMLVKSGAHGYMLKNSGQEELSAAIRKIVSGKSFFDARVVEQMMNSGTKKTSKPNSVMPSLTRREKEILQLIIKEHTSQEIAKQLFVSVGTVETHRRNMISKMGVRNMAGLVSKTYEFGILD